MAFFNWFKSKEEHNAKGNIYGIYPYQSQNGLSDTKGDKSAMLREYQSWVYACVSSRAQSVASANFRIFRRNAADDFEELDDHPSIVLLDNPNPLDTKYDMLYKVISYMDLTGDAFIEKVKDGAGRLRELWVLPSEKMTIIPSEDGVIKGYELRPYGAEKSKVIPYGVDEIIHLKHPNIRNFYYGASVLEAAATAVDINNFQHTYQKNFYKNSAIPPAIYETDSKLNDDVVKRLRNMIQSVYGGGANAGKSMILEQGLKYKAMGINPKDLDWLATNKSTLTEICAIFKVPPAMLGIVEDVNRSTAESQEYTYAKMAIEPLLRNIDQRLTTGLLNSYLDGRKLFFQHDSTVPMDEDRRASATQKRIQSGLTTINEERKLEGYKPVANGDNIIVPVNYMPLDQMVKRDVTQENKPLQDNQATV